MKSLLFVINTLGMGGGAEKALLELLKLIDAEKYEVHLFVLTGQGELVNQIPSHVKVLNKKYFPISVLNKKGEARLFRTVIKALTVRRTFFKRLGYIIKNLCDMMKEGNVRKDKLFWKVLSDGAQRLEKEYDLAVAFLEGGAAYYVSSYVRAKKKVAFVHINYLYAGYNRKLDEDCYLLFDHIFAVSESVRKTFLSVYPECEKRTTVFYNLIDKEDIVRKSMEKGGFTDKYEGVRILTVGRLVPQKAINVAIDTMKILKETGKPFRWYVLGEGELRRNLEEQIRALSLEEDFFLLGTVDNPYPYYRQCDLYVHTASYEGKSIAIEEAQSLGCTILASDYNGVQEQIEDETDGKICRLDANILAKNILFLADNPQKRTAYSKAASKRESTNNQKEIRKLLRVISE